MLKKFVNQSWSVTIFGYIEEKTIADVVKKASAFLSDNNIAEREIIIVDDGSRDDSEQIIRELIKNIHNINYIRHSQNQGIGPALLS